VVEGMENKRGLDPRDGPDDGDQGDEDDESKDDDGLEDTQDRMETNKTIGSGSKLVNPKLNYRASGSRSVS
jgi:hypothetical protein